MLRGFLRKLEAAALVRTRTAMFEPGEQDGFQKGDVGSRGD
jgi:hypothetical protein